MKRLLAGLLIFVAHQLAAQDTSVTASFGKLKLQVNSAVGLGLQDAALRLNSGQPLIRKMSFWVTGLSPAGDTLVVAEDVFSRQTHWCEGPAAFSGEQRITRTDWPRIIRIQAAEIAAHRKNYSNAGYQLPPAISRWPADFRRTGFPVVLAPFADADFDGKYTPAQGDYPFVPGNDHIWTMAADSLGKAALKDKPTSIDMAVLWYAPKGTDTMNNYTSGYRITICNRGVTPVKNTRLSAVSDFSVGSETDDYLATDVRNRALIGYNSKGTDALLGSGLYAPAIGWYNMSPGASIYFEPTADAVNGRPLRSSHFYHLASGAWKTGTRLGWGGRGLDPSAPARFVYSGLTDPNFKSEWSEPDLANTPGRRTALISTDTFTLQGGACKVIDGFVTIIPGGYDTLRWSRHLKEVHRIYNNSEYTLAINAHSIGAWKVFPNPAGRSEMIHHNLPDGLSYQILDATGRVVAGGSAGAQIIKTPDASGVYFLLAGGRAARFVVAD